MSYLERESCIGDGLWLLSQTHLEVVRLALLPDVLHVCQPCLNSFRNRIAMLAKIWFQEFISKCNGTQVSPCHCITNRSVKVAEGSSHNFLISISESAKRYTVCKSIIFWLFKMCSGSMALMFVMLDCLLLHYGTFMVPRRYIFQVIPESFHLVYH